MDFPVDPSCPRPNLCTTLLPFLIILYVSVVYTIVTVKSCIGRFVIRVYDGFSRFGRLSLSGLQKETNIFFCGVLFNPLYCSFIRSQNYFTFYRYAENT